MKMGKKPLLALLFVAACDPQATEAYNGESLLSVRGSVELALERDNSDQLQPSVAFRGEDDLFYVLDDVDVRGEFPAEFELDILAPPPPDAIHAIDERHPERLAVGYITAVTPELPDVFDFHSSDGTYVISDSMAREWSCDLEGDRDCRHDELICEGDECVLERTTCAFERVEQAPDGCAISEEEDSATQWENFAGLSENYIVLYLESPAPKGSWIAHEVGAADAGLAAGYHLLKARLESADEEVARRECHDRAEALAFTRLNEEHGTSYADFIDLTEQLDREYTGLLEHAEVELDCPTGELVVTRVDHPESESITVRIGPNVHPL